MKNIKVLFTLSLMAFFLALPVIAQKDTPAPLASGASLEQTQLWLKNTLLKYGRSDAEDPKKIKLVTAQSCFLTYYDKLTFSTPGAKSSSPAIFTTPTESATATTSYGAGINTPAASNDPGTLPFATPEPKRVFFDLKGILPGSIQLTRIAGTDEMRLTALYEPSPEYLDKLKKLAAEKKGTEVLIDDKYLLKQVFRARENAAGPLKDGFTQAVNLCRAGF